MFPRPTTTDARRRPGLPLALALVALVATTPGTAAAAGPQDGPPPFQVSLQAIGDGRGAFHERTATPAGDTLVVRDLDMTRPVFVGVEPVERGAHLEVALYKFDQREPVRRGQPDADGAFTFAFRTYDEVAIEVKSPQPTAYRTAILVAPPVEPSMPSPFVGPPASPAGAAGAGRWVASGAVGLGVVLALLVWARRRRAVGAATGILAAALLAGQATVYGASVQGPPDTGPVSSGPATLRGLGGPTPAASVEPPGVTGWGPATKTWLEGVGRGEKEFKEFHDSIQKYGQLLDKFGTLLGSLQRLAELSEQDLDYEPDYAPPGMPRVPAACAVNAKCNACYAPAYDNLSAVRRKLENNRIVLANYTRRMNAIDDAGRGLGSMHGGLGIVYMQNKVDWDQQRQHIAGIYDGRYTALLTDLQAALRGIEACEQAYSATQAWYDRFGFMYYEFMAARYKRTGNYGF